MTNEYFGELTFDAGWTMKRKIQLFGKTHEVEVHVLAYSSEPDILPVQEEAWIAYSGDESNNLKRFETLMKAYDKNAELRFIPTTLHFDRKGSCALLCNDIKDPDGGIAVCIAPRRSVISQDDYL